MNWELVKREWKQMSRNLKARWDKLTDDDLERIAGSRERLVARLRDAYGLTAMGAETQLDDWERHQQPIGHADSSA